MFRKIAAFELRYQLSSPVFWVSCIAFFLLTFGATVIPQIQIGDKGNTFINAPFAIIQVCAIMAIFAMFIVTAFVANVVVRDDDTGYGPIIRSTRIGKFDYLFGRFLGAYLTAMIIFAVVPLAILIGSAMPWLDPVKLGPFRPADYLYAYFIVGAPTVLLTSAIFFALATATRSMMATYLGVIAFLIMTIVLTQLFKQPQYDHIVALLEPFGGGAIREVTKYWTAADRNTMLPPVFGIVAENRLLWVGISFLFLTLTYFIFRFETRGARRAVKPAKAEAAPRAHAGPLPSPHFDRVARRVQALAWTRFEMAQVFRSPGYLVLLALGLFNSVGAMWFLDEDRGFHLLMVTKRMIEALQGGFSFIPVIIAIYYAGELVWRERDRRTHELFDACPVPDWTFVLPKVAAIVLVLFSTFLVSVGAAVLIQTIKGYHDYEFAHYITWYVLPETVTAVQIAVLAVFVQALSPNKYLGWGVMVLYLVATLTFSTLGFEHHLYLYATTSGVPLSDMNGEGRFWIGRDWFDVYWSAVALVLTVLAYGLWRRGSETRLKPRFMRLPRRLAGPAGAVLAVGLVIAVGSGGFIYYNTNILNPYRTSTGNDQYQADYEKALWKYHAVPQPKITAVTLDVALYPHQVRAVTHGTYTIANRSGKPLKAIHIRWDRDLKMKDLAIDGAHVERNYKRFDYRIYAFDKPMMPGEVRHIRFETVLAEKGFRNSGNLTGIVANGTFVNNMEIAPALGMDRSALLHDPSKRRRYGLPSQRRPPKLEDDAARRFNYLRHDSDWVTSDITVSTEADQTPIAPGYRVSDETADGRRIARFESEARILNFFSIQSARYKAKRDKWHGVNLVVYYDPHHPYNVDRILHALKVGLGIYTKAFSPYQFRQVRIIEFPDYAKFAQSFANTIPFSEGVGFIQNSAKIDSDPTLIDMVTYVTAHELGHQWWAHQVIGADMQGMTMLSETFAQYSAMLVMEKLYGPNHVRKFLKEELDAYLRTRGSEEVEELPLERVEDQGYIHYRKGAVVMYRLKQAVGEDVVNQALRKLLANYAFKPAPYPSSKDFVKYLREAAGPKYDQLITDLFQKITVYDLRAKSASWKKRADGKYDVTLTVEAQKYYADGKGKETQAPMQEDVPVGAFTTRPGDAGFGKKDVLAWQTVPIHTGTQIVHLVTDKAPAFAGIDPYIEWIDRNADDNLTAAAAAGGS